MVSAHWIKAPNVTVPLFLNMSQILQFLCAFLCETITFFSCILKIYSHTQATTTTGCHHFLCLYYIQYIVPCHVGHLHNEFLGGSKHITDAKDLKDLVFFSLCIVYS